MDSVSICERIYRRLPCRKQVVGRQEGNDRNMRIPQGSGVTLDSVAMEIDRCAKVNNIFEREDK